MSDEARSHPPSERRLARLWSGGATPAGPGLVAAAVLLAAAGMSMALAPALWGGAAGLVRDALVLASEPETALAGAGALAVRGLVVIAAAALLLSVVALGVQLVQAGPRPSEPPGQTAQAAGAATATGAVARGDGVRSVALVLLAAVAIAVVVRTGLVRAAGFAPEVPLERAARQWAGAVGGPLLALVLAAAVLDTLLRRRAWTRTAWMTRRELEEELRESEGHPLTRRRRAPARRRRHA